MGRSKTTQSSTATVPGFIEDFYSNEVFPMATDIGQMPFTPYEGQMVADVSQTSLGALPYYDQIGQISGMTPADYQAMNEANLSGYTANVLDPALARMAREREIAQTQEMADITRSGAFGNERRGVYEGERQATYELGRDQMIADLMRQGYNEAQAATMAQLQIGQGAAGQAAAGLQQVGGLQQTTDQAALEAAYNEFLREQNYPLQTLGALVGAGGLGQGLVGQTTTQSSSPGFAGTLGAIGAAGQALSAFSDRRLKENVVLVANVAGIKFYRWTWNEEAKRIGADSIRPFGVIAQELREQHPEFVHEGDDGYLRVDYDGLEAKIGNAA